MGSSHVLQIPAVEFQIINYPLIIQNENKALQTLGGADTISEFLKLNSFETTKKRIPLHLRPDMIYSKPLMGEYLETKGLLIKMRQLRNKKTGEIQVIPEILGHVKSIYEFNCLCDYQYNPHRSISTPDSFNPEVFYDKLIPNKSFMELNDFENYINSNEEIFLPPIIFTKSEKPAELRLSKTTQECLVNNTKKTDFDIEAELANKELKSLNEIFDKQPIWTATSLFNALKQVGVTNCHRINRIRREVADHILKGPWRRTWVKRNYDYTSNPESRMFQVIEFRGNPSQINFVKNYFRQIDANPKSEAQIEESSWKISERHLPTSVNCFYQLCHIEIPAVIELVRAEPVPTEASEEHGWFLCDIGSKVRSLIQQFLADQVVLLTKNKAPL